MVNVVIVLDCKPQAGNAQNVKAEVNLLKREDANDVEWAIAKLLEPVIETALRGIATRVSNYQRID
jgi:hypothetical protein